MIDLKKQIAYWTKGAEDDLMTAELLIREKRILHGLFFCHLVIEKAIKAHIVKTSGEAAPRSHNLIFYQKKQTWNLTMKPRYFWGF
ncbi:MAG: HEPN domain-containing protein [Bacteroidetes bacterium]|jgi:HEPN domain-containing protein|nr:HEPN domain-containing protein [Bacteroidota bacterium]